MARPQRMARPWVRSRVDFRHGGRSNSEYGAVVRARPALLACALAWALVAGRASAAPLTTPPTPNRWVTDTVGFLTPSARTAFDQRLEAYERQTGHQVVVWIGASLHGAPLEDWASRTFAAWKLGRKGKDDGLALFLFIADRKMAIEVGYGLEAVMTDAAAKRIIDEKLAPALRAGQNDQAVDAALDALIATIDGQPLPDSPADDANAPHAAAGGIPVRLILWGIVSLLLLVFAVTHPRLALHFLVGIVAGGRGRGGGFGGGFSGGGGRSGGGGARGSW